MMGRVAAVTSQIRRIGADNADTDEVPDEVAVELDAQIGHQRWSVAGTSTSA